MGTFSRRQTACIRTTSPNHDAAGPHTLDNDINEVGPSPLLDDDDADTEEDDGITSATVMLNKIMASTKLNTNTMAYHCWMVNDTAKGSNYKVWSLRATYLM
jgi:hypothetical protein